MADARFARINERTSNPNPHFKFITSLPGKKDSDIALELLRALAAQVKVICKNHGMQATSFEEHEWNPVFGGRNWNAGEAIEIVLRRPNGKFFPAKWLIHVVLHELTHCHHMNHGPGFQKMLRGLEQEMAALHAKGYFGDGFWSSGSRLSDGFLQMSNPLHENKADYGEYLCGGAQKSKRPTSSKRNHRKNGLPLVSFASTSSGAQTAKKHKPGTRNLKAFDDKPSGNRLDGQRVLTSEEKKELRRTQAEEKAREKEENRLGARGLGGGKRKPKVVGGGGTVGGDTAKVLLGTTGQRARSKKASEARADAAERRLNESKPTISESSSEEDTAEDEPEPEGDDSATESDDDEPRRPLAESTDDIRRRLEETRVVEGSSGKERGAWMEFVDLTKDEEDGGEAKDWLMSDEEKERVKVGEWKGKGKEKAKTRQSVVRFNSKTIDLETDSEEEDLSLDPYTSPKRRPPVGFLPKPILKKPSPPSKSTTERKEVEATEASPSPSSSSLLPTSRLHPNSPKSALSPLKPSAGSSSSNGRNGNPGSSSVSATKLTLPAPRAQPAHQPPLPPSSPTTAKTGAKPLLPFSSKPRLPPPLPGSSSTSSRPLPSTSSVSNRAPQNPSSRPSFSAAAPPPAIIQQAAAQAFGTLPPSIPLDVAARINQSIADQLAAAGIPLPPSSLPFHQLAPPPPPPSQQPTNGGQPWNCRMCTFANNALLSSCEMCEAPKVAPPPPRVRGMFDRPSPPPAAVPALQAPPPLPQSHPFSSWSASSFSSSSSGTRSYQTGGNGTRTGTFDMGNGAEVTLGDGRGGGWVCWSCGQGGNDTERWACSTCFAIKKAS